MARLRIGALGNAGGRTHPRFATAAAGFSTAAFCGADLRATASANLPVAAANASASTAGNVIPLYVGESFPDRFPRTEVRPRRWSPLGIAMPCPVRLGLE